nr:hypothetical protein CFP56_65308 [Quercus suber]
MRSSHVDCCWWWQAVLVYSGRYQRKLGMHEHEVVEIIYQRLICLTLFQPFLHESPTIFTPFLKKILSSLALSFT